MAKLQRALSTGADAKRRAAALKPLLEAQPSDAPTLDRWLHRRTRLAPRDYKNLLRFIGAQVPDAQGRFVEPEPRPGKRVTEAVPVLEPDWLEALLRQDPSRLPASSKLAYVDTLLDVALIRGLAASCHPDAAVSLLRFAFRHEAAFKDECGRQIREMGSCAVPGLIRARMLRDPLAYKMGRYAAYQLDRMDCARPDRALKLADPELRVEILHAYGEVRDASAVGAVIDFADSHVPRVRRAARWALLRYLSGRPPKVATRKLRLPGGRETTEEKALYLTYQQLAHHTIIEKLTQVLTTGAEADTPKLDVKQLQQGEPRALAEQLFTLLDRRSAKAQQHELESAWQLARAGNLDRAIEAFDRLLALDPYPVGRERLAPLYHRRGTELLEQGQPTAAARLLSKALHLAPLTRDARQLEAERDLAEVLARDTWERSDVWLVRRAIAVAPRLALGHVMLRQIAARKQRQLMIVLAVSGTVAVGLLLALVALRRRFTTL